MSDPRIGYAYGTWGWPQPAWNGAGGVSAAPSVPGVFASGMTDLYTPDYGMVNGTPTNAWRGDIDSLYGYLSSMFAASPVWSGAPVPNQGVIPIPGAPISMQDEPREKATGLKALPKDPDGIPVRIIEVGTDRKIDQHGKQVAEIFGNNLGTGKANAKVSILDKKNQRAPGGVDFPKAFNNKKDLDQLIDFKGTYILSQMAKEINATESGVMNVSAGWTKASIYTDVITTLKSNLNLASAVGLTKLDLYPIKFEKLENGDQVLNLETVPEKVREKVVAYVGQRLNVEGSAHQNALKLYQDAAHKAANERNVSIVVAAANDGENRKLYKSAQNPDTNFLVLSDDVISVAAADTRGTSDVSDDTIAEFSSHGTEQFKPTIATNGVNVSTSFGNVNGTSFASPYVAALVTEMLQANPQLTPADIKKKLQEAALDTNASEKAEGAGILDVTRLKPELNQLVMT